MPDRCNWCNAKMASNPVLLGGRIYCSKKCEHEAKEARKNK